MRFSAFLQKSTKVYKEDLSKNAQLLVKAGFINCLMSGVYSYLPLGLRVLKKIENIVRDEMNKIGGQEILMPVLQPREIWDTTGRWDTVDVLFKLKGHGDRDLALGPTHEEVVSPLIAPFINSYKDLPKAVYQIQTKFRNEARAKSGILRGREFLMKDLYSFHASQEDLDVFYEKVAVSYRNIYNRCGIGDKTILTFASGGVFSKYSHEFQTITPAGEDTIYKVNDNLALNDEIIDDPNVLKEFNIKDKSLLKTEKTIEVGNIFKLGTKFSDAFAIKYDDRDGGKKTPLMGCYGIGISRVMGAVVECLADEKGLVWTDEVAPFKVHLVRLTFKEDEIEKCDEIYDKLLKANIDVLYDDRRDVGVGEKLNDADLFGIPHRLVVSSKTLSENKIEYKKRSENEVHLVEFEKIYSLLGRI
jgi:prolyl-tRNA synthetase